MAYLLHRLDQEERSQLGFAADDALAIAEAKGRRKILSEMLAKDFGKEAQDWMRKECTSQKKN